MRLCRLGCLALVVDARFVDIGPQRARDLAIVRQPFVSIFEESAQRYPT